MYRVFLTIALILVSLRPADAASLALVIGNDSYEEVTDLKKARSDSLGYAAILQARGFDVTRIEDVDGREMRVQLSIFFDRISPGDIVVFAYSGHGWSDGSNNYLLPTDISGAGSPTLIAAQSFTLRNGVNGIVDQIHSRSPSLAVAIIDACRDNPFASNSSSRSVGLARGLVRVSAPNGTFIAFSAGEGQTALDRLSDNDPEQYSVFTRHFLAELSKAQDLQSAFKATQIAVNRDAKSVGHAQRPAYYDEVIGTACLSPGCEAVTPAQQEKPKTEPLQTRTVLSAAEEWQDFMASKSIVALTLFAERHEGTPYAALARERIEELSGNEVNTKKEVVEQPSATARPSWCPQARTATEMAICRNDTLSTYDIRTGRLYSQMIRKLTGSQERLFVNKQKSWLEWRNRCGASEGCLINAYEQRLYEITR